MITEADIGGMLFAPIVVYAAVAMAIFAALRWVFGRIGLLGGIWHPALFEVALFTAILSLLVLFL